MNEMTHLNRWRWWISTIIAALLLNSAASAQELTASGAGKHLWIIRGRDAEQILVLHRHLLDTPGELRRAKLINGNIMRAGMAASDEHLWLVYHDLSVHRLTVFEPDPADLYGQWRYELSIERSPPEGLTLRSLAAAGDNLWALVRVEDAQTLQALQSDSSAPVEGADEDDEDDEENDEERSHSATGTASPADHEADGAELEDGRDRIGPAGADEDSSARAAQAVREDRLIYLRRSRWAVQDLPADWPQDARAWVVASDSSQSWPDIVLLDPEQDTSGGERDVTGVRVYRRAAAGQSDGVASASWRREDYTLPRAGTVAPLAVDGQIVIAQVRVEDDRLQADLAVLRGGDVLPIGSVEVDGFAARPEWAVAPMGSTIALIGADESGRLAWSRIDLTGRPLDRAAVLTEAQAFDQRPLIDNFILVAVVVFATFVLFMFWRRDPAWNRLELPGHLALADLPARALAGLIDLVPALLVVMFIYQVSFGDLYNRWPGRSGGLERMQPGLLAIAIFVLHSGLGELLSCRSLGKLIMRLQVVDIKGGRPRWWQLLLRNVLKAADLIALPLLILPMIGPNRQRLGDLVGRTVVVTARPPEPPESPEEAPPEGSSTEETPPKESRPEKEPGAAPPADASPPDESAAPKAPDHRHDDDTT